MRGWFRRRQAPETGLNATQDDIAACFRLLLGRPPNPEEMAGHMGQAGQPLSLVVAGYLNSLEFSRRGLMQAAPGRHELVQYETFQIVADVDDIAVGRHIASRTYEPEIAATMRRLLRPGMHVLDVGANMGFFTMLAADIVGAAGSVMAVEPNPNNTRLIEVSRSANGFGWVTIAQAGAGRHIGLLNLNATHSNGTTSPILSDLSGALSARPVACLPLDHLVAGQPVDLIKIDVEGAELNALIGAEHTLARSRPIIISEFSPGLLEGISGIDGRGYLAWLQSRGYRLAVIGQDGDPEPESSSADAIMSIYDRRRVDHIDLLAEPDQ